MNERTEHSAGNPGGGAPTRTWRVVEVGVLLLMTLVAGLVTLYAREVMQRPPIRSNELRFEFNPFAMGIAIQWLIVPLVLIYLLSGTRFFRRIIGGEVQKRDRLRLAGTLAAIELITLAYDVSFPAPDRSVLGVFVLTIGGLLGGWRLGLGLGLIGLLVSGSIAYFGDLGGGRLVASLRGGVPPGVPAVEFWVTTSVGVVQDFVLFYIVNLRGSMSVWVGIAAGLVGSWLEDAWRIPAVAFALGAALDLSSAFLILPTAAAPVDFTIMAIASAFLSGLGLAGFALIVRSVQADVARRKATEAELAVAHAELRALRAQIKPHFLFNALNTIRYFVRTDPEAARQLLLNLSEVFQKAIRSGEFVPLRDELSCVQAYLSLEQARLGERLKVTWSGAVADPQRLHEINSPLLERAVPTLSIQPIVENAVVHGVSKKPEGGMICITVEELNRELVVQVEDDGIGMEPARLAAIRQPAQEGDTSIGIRNVDGRLQALYGAGYGLAIESAVGRGTRVKMRIPFERS